MQLTDLAIRLIIGFFSLFILVKIIGKKIISQITPFHFICSIVLSELLGNAVYDDSIDIIHILFTISVWGGLIFLVEYLAQKSPLFRQIFEGKPSMVIRDGQIDFKELKRCRMNISQLQSVLRQSETFSVREVAFAFVESNGSISILKKTPYQKTTLQDFNMPDQKVYLPITLIRDGSLVKENLEELGKDIHWLIKQLSSNNISKIEDVLLAEWLENDKLFVIPYNIVKS
ncbi:YetF domain-containing protein [Alkalithermobacter paradoxus]|uniref:DUF421 domain-containing protein n=1 Tax=Alkalithermobacter paradoxus TaxID=29349 RepID=A0A1V4I730_9FIRM|nr:hypothetical protein CLOTH_14730 [[Clostridium] thermoalcaliphilum]